MEDKGVIKITTLFGEFTDKAELQEYSNKLFISLKKSEQKVKQLEEEVEHLKVLLAANTPLIPNSMEGLSSSFQVPSEQEICEIQIELIKKRGMDRELTLDDAKKLEVLVKTLNTVKEKNKAPKEVKSKLHNVSDDVLKHIASLPIKEGSDD